MFTAQQLAERWTPDDWMEVVYRVTWQTAAHGIIEAQRVLGKHGVVAKVNRECPTWFTVEEWRGHAIGRVRLGTIVRNAAGEYERLRVN